MSDKSEWIWMPHPGHFCAAQQCRFILNTCVGHYIVSTVGEWLPPEAVREIFAEHRGVKLEGLGDARLNDYVNKIGFEDIGLNKKYETMVFPAIDSKEKCCPKQADILNEVEVEGYNCPKEAHEGHMRLCDIWSKMNEEKEQG